MAPFDSGTWIVLGLGLGLIGAFAWLFADWRELTGTAEHLPVWSFLEIHGKRRDGARIDERGVRLAGLRCAACDSRRSCAARLSAGFVSPVADCPNAPLFSPPGA
jgi:hypothetical protein